MVDNAQQGFQEDMPMELDTSTLEEPGIEQVQQSDVVNQSLQDPTGASEPKAQNALFRFSLAKAKTSVPRPPLFRASKLDRLDDVEYVTEFCGKGRKASQFTTRIIPKLENLWRPEKRMRNLMVESDLSAIAEDRFETDTLAAGPQPNVQYGLHLKQSDLANQGETIDAPEANGLEPQQSFAEVELQRLREDIQVLPEATSLDAYENVPVEEFAEALLRGMGWEKGKPIGRNSKTVVAPIEPVKRVGREGLGAIPAPKPEKVKQFIKPGETRVRKPTVGKIMSIIAGVHVGLRGQVTEVNGNSFVLMLVKGGEKVRAREEDLAEIGSSEEEKAMKRLRELRLHRTEDDIREDRWSGRVANDTDDQAEKVQNRGESRAKKKEDTDSKGSWKEGRSSVSTGSGKKHEWSDVSSHQRWSDDRAGRRHRNHDGERNSQEGWGSRHQKYDDERYRREGKSRSRREEDDYIHKGKDHSYKIDSRRERHKSRNNEKDEDYRHNARSEADRHGRGDSRRN